MVTQAESMTPPQSGTRRRVPWRWRGIVYRAGAVAVGLALFVIVEVVLAVLGLGAPDYHDDPFAGFSSVRPLFVLNEEADRYEIAKSRLDFFRRDWFAAEKGENEFRIFCLGGSTVQGRPFAIETSFSTFLEISLEAAEPNREWQVVNCGGISYASYRLVPVLREVLQYEPDLIIIYTGHNEFLEDRTYSHIKTRAAAIALVQDQASRLRTFNLLRAAYRRIDGSGDRAQESAQPVLSTEVDVRLNHPGGLAKYHRDEKWRRDVIAHFGHGLRSMAQMAQERGVPLLLVDPACNVRDCPPFKSEHNGDLTPAELEKWNALYAQARKTYSDNMLRSVELLRETLQIDDQHAGIHYQLGKCYDALAMTTEAFDSYNRAKELDVCPLRILDPMNEAIRDVARDWEIPLVDIRGLILKKSRNGIPGADWFLDHVHPSVRGHQLIANALAEEMAEQGMVHPDSDWHALRKRMQEAHVESIDNFYFVKGQERLNSVREWARGGVE